MQKAYVKRNFKNRPNTTTPLGESNLNPIDNAIDEIDNRVVTFDTTKANQSDFLTALKNMTYNSQTGVFTITKFNDSTFTIDTDLEKLAINFDYDDDPTSAHYQNLIITLEDGTVKYVDMSALITEYEFGNTNTINFTVSSSTGIVTANVINGSITYDHLAPALQTIINGAESYSEESEAWATGQINGTDVPITADQYHNNSMYYSGLSKDSSEDSEAYAIGKRNGIDVPSTDPTYENNAKYWADQARVIAHGTAGNISYDNTTSGLTADDVQEAIDELSAEKVDDNLTFSEAETRTNISSGESFTIILGKIKKFFTDLKTVAFSGSYDDLSNKPTIPPTQVNSDWNAVSGVAEILNKPTIPTNTNQLTNGAGFITSNDVFNHNVEVIDANTAPEGFSCIQGGSSNSPFSFWCSLITMRYAANYVQQIALPWAYGERTIMAYRKCDSGVWSAWDYVGTNIGSTFPPSSSLVYWDNDASKPYIYIDGNKHYFTIT